MKTSDQAGSRMVLSLVILAAALAGGFIWLARHNPEPPAAEPPQTQPPAVAHHYTLPPPATLNLEQPLRPGPSAVQFAAPAAAAIPAPSTNKLDRLAQIRET